MFQLLIYVNEWRNAAPSGVSNEVMWENIAKNLKKTLKWIKVNACVDEKKQNILENKEEMWL